MYERLSRLDDALEAYSKSLDIKIKVVGQDCPQVAYAQNKTAMVYQQQGKFEEDLELYNAALEIKNTGVRPALPAFGQHAPEHWTSASETRKGHRCKRVFFQGIPHPLRQMGPNHPHPTMLKRFA